METVRFNKEPIVNTDLGNPMMKPLNNVKQFTVEKDGIFRDSVKALGFDAKYSGKGVRSDFIEGIHLD